MDIDVQEKSSATVTATVCTGIEFGYLSFIDVFELESVIFLPSYPIGSQNVRFDFKAYPERLVNWASKSDKSPLYPPAYIEAYEPSWLLCYGTLAASIRRDLTWTLCSPVFEQIREMIIPLSDMGRYLDAIERFKSLKEVSFKMDEIWVDECFQDSLSHAETKDEVKELERLRDTRDEQFKSMTTFVKRHQALFPNLLQQVDCPPDYTWKTPMACPTVICNRLKSLLLGVDRPTTINSTNVDEIADRIASIDLGLVDSVSIVDRITAVTSKDPSFLSRCRAL